MTDNTPITIAYGDGIGPEIMQVVLLILREAGAKIHFDIVDIGEINYEHGYISGITQSAWKIIERNPVFLKSPITTPQGKGYKSLNVTLRKALGLYANIRPCVSYHPHIVTKHPDLDVVVIRENEEGLYSGIEHRQTRDSFQSIKLVTRNGCERINDFAFRFAGQNGRKKITCFSKDDILRLTDGMFHSVFDKTAGFYPEIEHEHFIVDNGIGRLAAHPGEFDVIVTGNLYGDIVSDILSNLSGSLGLSGSANIGKTHAMFEPVHGSAPDIADKDIANPSGLIHSAIMMLVHIGQNDVANTIHNAWLSTIEDGIHTADIYNDKTSKIKVGTKAFADAVMERLGNQPRKLEGPSYDLIADVGAKEQHEDEGFKTTKERIELVGVDVFFEWDDNDVGPLATKLLSITENTTLKLQMIGNRGFKVWPDIETNIPIDCDLWRGRFFVEGDKKTVARNDIIQLLSALEENGVAFTQVQNLSLFDGGVGFSLVQGE